MNTFIKVNTYIKAKCKMHKCNKLTFVSVTGGMYMGATQMGYVPAAGYGQYQALGAQQGMMGPVMAPRMNVLGQAGVMPQPGGAPAPPYMAGMQGGMMGMQNGMMGGMPAVPQQPYGTQQAQQMQWNISQVTRLEPKAMCRRIRRFRLCFHTSHLSHIQLKSIFRSTKFLKTKSKQHPYGCNTLQI